MVRVRCERQLKLGIGGKVTLELEMNGYATIRQLKLGIAALSSFPSINRMTLSYVGEVLNDDSTIKSCGIKDHGLILVDVAPLPGDPEFQIFVEYKDNFKGMIEVKETYTVQDLKNKIKAVCNIPTRRMTLTHHHLNTPMEDGPLMSYYICAGALIDVGVK